MAVSTNQLGSLIHARLQQFGEVIFWDRTRPPVIGPHPDDEEYIVKTNERYDLLAFNKLGSSELWWVIARRNNICLFPNDLYEKRKILIPSRQSLIDRGILEPLREF